LTIAGGAILALLLTATVIWRDDIIEALLDPKIPYTVYKPPPPPNYALNTAWALLPSRTQAAGVDVFFIHPTTFDGGKDWNGPIDDRAAAALMARAMAPNYAAPFDTVGRVFAPRYRQASLYTSLTLFDDALEAKRFAYADVSVSFRYFLDHFNAGRPYIVVGVEQGGLLASRLLHDVIATDPRLRSRLVGAYLQETVAPADAFGRQSSIPVCISRTQTGCVLAWISTRRGDFPRALRIYHRSVVWNERGQLIGLGSRVPLCVNPLLGEANTSEAPPRLNLGAANATGLEWGARPGFMTRQVGAQCVDGILRVTRPRSASLRPAGGWLERLRVPPYNLFYADLAADARGRAAAWLAANPPRQGANQGASQTVR
jgi:hypothetical protein